jgi:hypothetical protein
MISLYYSVMCAAFTVAVIFVLRHESSASEGAKHWGLHWCIDL